MTTADLRSAAYEARINGEFAKAADLYTRAADAYRNPTGAMAQDDIKGLRAKAEVCRSMGPNGPRLVTFTCGCGQKVQMFMSEDSERKCLDCRDADSRARDGWTPENSCD